MWTGYAGPEWGLFFCHSGLDPESRLKGLVPIACPGFRSGVRRDGAWTPAFAGETEIWY
jgi:hypothetical protein